MFVGMTATPVMAMVVAVTVIEGMAVAKSILACSKQIRR